jgi:hypothetical protein
LRRGEVEAISRPLQIGVWLSLVEHLVRDEGVAGSNPATPTSFSITWQFPLLHPAKKLQ